MLFGSLFVGPPLLATDPVPTTWHAVSLGEALLATAAFGLVGIAIMALGFKIFEWITPRLDLEKQLEEKNMAVAVVVAAVILGLTWLVTHAMS